MEKLLEEYRRRAKKIALQKSAFFGALIGFGVDFLAALVLLFIKSSTIVVLLSSLGLGILCGVLAAVLFYFKIFYPTEKSVARMVDKLGLEERVVTMCEMEEDASHLAALQRGDAKEKLHEVSPSLLKCKISTALVVVFALTFTLALSMTAVSTVNAAKNAPQSGETGTPVLPSHKPDEEPEEVYIEIYYLAGEGGTVSGETYQRILKGKDASPVVAEAAEGYTFLQWNDGIMTKERWDWSVMEDMTVTAIFSKPSRPGTSGSGQQGEGEGGEEKEPGQGDGEGNEQGEQGEQGESGEQGEEGEQGEGESGGDGEGNEQGEEGEQGEGESSGDGEGGKDGEGDDGAGDSEGQGGSKPSEGQEGSGGNGGSGESSEGSGGGAGSGGQRDDNSVVDGKTDYKDASDYEREKEKAENDDSLPPELKDALSGYFDGMKP